MNKLKEKEMQAVVGKWIDQVNERSEETLSLESPLHKVLKGSNKQ